MQLWSQFHSTGCMQIFYISPPLISHAPAGRASFPPGEAKALALLGYRETYRKEPNYS